MDTGVSKVKKKKKKKQTKTGDQQIPV